MPEFEHELADAVEAIISALAEGDYLESDVAAARALGIYLVQQERIEAAAERCQNAGLHTACSFMSANILELVGRGTALSARECALIHGWPNALVEYCADPFNPDAVGALVAHVSDAAWTVQLSTDEVESLARMMLANPDEQLRDESAPPHGVAGFEGAGEDAIAQPDAPAGANNLPMSSCADPVFLTANTSFSRVPYAPRVAWMIDLAERKGMVGVYEVCEIARQAVTIWEAQDDGMSPTQCETLEELLGVAKVALAEASDPALAERLIKLLGNPIWPEALSGDQRELLSELLQADMLVRESCAEHDADDGVAEKNEHRSQTAAVEAATESDDSSDDWLREQVVSDELVALLASEIDSAGDAIQQTLDAACDADNANAGDAASQYVDEVERVSAAANAVGLSALHVFLGRLTQTITARVEVRPSARQQDVLRLLPSAIASYLAAPTDRSAAEGLVDLLRSEAWSLPLAQADAARLVQALGLVEVSHDADKAPARQTEVTPDDISLVLPADTNQELLDGLLLELPAQTGEFSSAMQNIATGHGSLGELDTAKRAAHTLKGAANTVGVRGIANLTHHLEDILIALSARKTLPKGALAETLVRASDCLEAMSEAVTGTGPEPDNALSVLREVLSWANRIDAEGIPEMEGAPGSELAEESGGAASANGGAATVSAGPMVRVSAALIDEMLRLVGETIISTAQIRDRLTKLTRDRRDIREQAGAFLGLANELEKLVDVGVTAGPVRAQAENADFDPLEFDHYSELHSVSRRLIESATDAREMGVGMDDDLAELRELAESQDRIHQLTQAVVMQTRMVPVSTVLSRLQRGVRQACRLLDKEAILNVIGGETLIDGNILNDLIDPLMHVLRNAVDHGIEPASVRASAGKPSSGKIDLAFAREGNQVVVRCRDDGGGLDLASIRRAALEKGLVTPEQTLSDDELAHLILTPGFSTRDEATQMSGRGIGMDIVRSRIQQMKGSLNLHSQAGKGLMLELRLPAALISTHALIVRSGVNRVAVSSHGIQDIQYVIPDQLQIVAGKPTYRVGDNLLHVIDLDALLNLPVDRRRDPRSGFPLLIVRLDSGQLHAVMAQEVLQSRNLIVKPLGRYAPKLRGVVGATILGDGSVAAVVDIPDLLAVPVALPQARQREAVGSEHVRAAKSQLSALVVDDSLSARRAAAQFMKDAGFDVRTAIDGLEAVTILEKWEPDVMLVDMEMPRMTGLELTAHVRASQGARARTPIIMITSRSTAKHRKQAEAAGVSVFLTKPFSDEELLRHVTQLTMAQHGA